jgi:arylformamidase
MILRDVSIVVSPTTPPWPGDTPFDCRWTSRLADGATVNLSAAGGSPHVGTHADAPLHVADGGAASEALPLAPFLGRAIVVSVSDEPDGELTIDAIERRSPRRRIERLLLRTGRTIAEGSFPEAWPAVTPACARELLDRGLKLLGVDAPSVDARTSTALEVHHALFGGGAFLLENLDLREVPDGEYELIALPQRIAGLDAAPVRAILRAI